MNKLDSVIGLLAVSALTVPALPGNVSAQQTGKITETVESQTAMIPAGSFLMGRERSALPAYVDDSPHKVVLDSFYMDKVEVTNARYQSFCQATGHRLPIFWGMKEFHSGPDFPDYPVVGVSHADAEAYAQWRGCRLPTEAEWEYAARGGLNGKDFPGGDSLETKDANIGHESTGTARVAGYAANGYRLFDMAGNVGEWVADYYDRDYYRSSPEKNPPGPAVGRFRVVRGGGWYSGKSCNAVHYRNALPASWVDFNVGFRCACDAGRPDNTGQE
ncbi:MAG: SUMF1/EgtB/PvdO family nonheme iron enzyme [Acidobacteriota bacterium]